MTYRHPTGSDENGPEVTDMYFVACKGQNAFAKLTASMQ